MERKPNKRVDDHPLLLTSKGALTGNISEKIFTQNIYAKKHQSDKNNSRHTRERNIVNEDLTVVNKTNWKVKFQK